MKGSLSTLLIGLSPLIPLAISGPVHVGALSSSWTPPGHDLAPSVTRRKEAKDTCKNLCDQPCLTKFEHRDKKQKCSCVPCDIGQKLNKKGTGCKKDKHWDKRHGNCPLGDVLDPAKPSQDKNTEKPICVPDDSVLCKKDFVPVSRDGKDRDNRDFTPECVPKEKKKCGKNEYVYVTLVVGKPDFLCKKQE